MSPRCGPCSLQPFALQAALHAAETAFQALQGKLQRAKDARGQLCLRGQAQRVGFVATVAAGALNACAQDVGVSQAPAAAAASLDGTVSHGPVPKRLRHDSATIEALLLQESDALDVEEGLLADESARVRVRCLA